MYVIRKHSYSYMLILISSGLLVQYLLIHLIMFFESDTDFNDTNLTYDTNSVYYYYYIT